MIKYTKSYDDFWICFIQKRVTDESGYTKIYESLGNTRNLDSDIFWKDNQGVEEVEITKEEYEYLHL